MSINSSAAIKDHSSYPSTYKKSGFNIVQQHISTIPTPKSSKNVTAAQSNSKEANKVPFVYRPGILDTSTVPTPKSSSKPVTEQRRLSD